MPELPEVETTKRGISPIILNQTITKVIVRHFQLRWPILPTLQKDLLKQKIILLERRGKYLILRTTGGSIIIHLGMSGHLRILNHTEPAKKHDHVDIIFSNKKILRLTDPRRFGAFLWVKGEATNHPLLMNLGVEPLSKSFTGKYLYLKFKNKKASIKSLLLNSKIVTGIGNIYAAEALFAASIHPAMPAHLISLTQLTQLTLAIKKILNRAIKSGGTTLKDFMKADGQPGYFTTKLNVYGREGLPCVRCGSQLKSIKIAQRNTVYCQQCQPEQS